MITIKGFKRKSKKTKKLKKKYPAGMDASQMHL